MATPPPLELFGGTLTDSPFHRQACARASAEGAAAAQRVGPLARGGEGYAGALAALTSHQRALGTALGLYANAETAAVGARSGGAHKGAGAGAELGRYAGALHALADLQEGLEGQLTNGYVDRLGGFIDDVARTKDLQKAVDRARAECEKAGERLQKLGKDARQEAVAAAHAEHGATRRAYHDARKTLLTQLQGNESRRKYAALEAAAHAMDAHLRYFKSAHQLFSDLAPAVHAALDEASSGRRRGQDAVAGLSAAMDSLGAEQEESAAETAAIAVGGHAAAGSRATAGPDVGSQLHKDFAAAMAAGGEPVPLKEGYLLKRSSNMLGDWKRRYFVLDSHGVFTYYRNASRDGSVGPAQATVSLLTATIKPDLDDADLRFCFRVISPMKTYALQAQSDVERAQWMEAITVVISELLNSQGDVGGRSNDSPDLPVTPTTHALVEGSLHRPTLSEANLPDITSLSPLKPTGPHHRRTHSAGSMGGDAPLEQLRLVDGNTTCADCGAPDPDWASLNLGVLLCIQCSGVHRQLGVHISKVRSTTLDVKVWEPSVMALFTATGNTFANRVWEERLHRPRTKTMDEEDIWSATDLDADVDDESALADLTPPSKTGLTSKPGPDAPLSEKSAYIQCKYSERRFVVESGAKTQDVVATAESGDVAACMRAIIKNGFAVSGNGVEQCSVALERASTRGDLGVLELLLQYGALPDKVLALHAALAAEQDAAATLLLKRGASASKKDAQNRTPLDVAMERGAVRDEELLALLCSG